MRISQQKLLSRLQSTAKSSTSMDVMLNALSPTLSVVLVWVKLQSFRLSLMSARLASISYRWLNMMLASWLAGLSLTVTV